MDHETAVREKMTEKYLLRELDPEVREQFEEHFFGCPECAQDIRAESEFVTYAKEVLAEKSGIASGEARAPQAASGGWRAWLRPAFAAPLLAVLIAIVGYQNLVVYPGMRAALKPHVLPWTSVAVGTWGGERPTITAAEGKGFLLFVRIPPDGAYARYMADLYNPNGKLESTLTIPAAAGQDQWPVVVPEAHRHSGKYRLVVSGVTSTGESNEVGSTWFDLQLSK
jgi:putative zinc finger protein